MHKSAGKKNILGVRCLKVTKRPVKKLLYPSASVLLQKNRGLLEKRGSLIVYLRIHSAAATQGHEHR